MDTLVIIGVVVAVLAVFLIVLTTCFKVAAIDKALIITGGKRPIIKVSGGSFVIPIIRKFEYFDLCMLTVKADKDEIRTTTSVPIVTDWTAQIRPDTRDDGKLRKAIVSFKERGQQGIKDDVKLTLTGAVRDIVASMTPEKVLRDKAEFAEKVKNIVEDEMSNMGLELVSLNIQDISDNYGYFDNLSAADREAKRKDAENIKAVTDQAVREQKADAERIATEAELASQLAIAEKQRNNAVRKAEYQTETDLAQANADIAGQLQATTRKRDLATEEGQVEVVRQQQANLAAQKKREVVHTEAETEKRRVEIVAEAAAEKAKIEAAARAAVMEKEATGKATAAVAEADGEAAAKKALAEAEAAMINMTGSAEAEVISRKGAAEADAIKAKALAEAEGEKALADARAANERVNFEITRLEIEMKARVEIATNVATVMAEIGKNAKFVDLGGGTGKNSNVLFDVLRGVPGLLEQLDVANRAMTDEGKPFNDTLKDLVNSVVEPLGVLNKASKEKETVVVSDTVKMPEVPKDGKDE